jgi:long-chain acyl-CoA synthetase
MKPGVLGSYVDRMEKWPDRVYLVGTRGYRARAWTYRAVISAIRAMSAELARSKIGKGDRVLLFGASCPEWVVAFFAVLERGAVVVPLDAGASPEFVKRILKKAKPSLSIGEPLPLRSALPFIPFSLIEELGHSGARGEPRDEGRPHGAREDARMDENTLAEIVFTSGTTSDPKGVMLTHGNILANLKPFAEGIDRRERLVRFLTPFRMLCAVPYSHMFGQAAGIFLPILLGSTVYFTRDAGPAALCRAIRRDRILTLITVPRVMKLLADHVKAELSVRGKMPSFIRRWDRLVRLPYPIRALLYLDIHRLLGLRFWSFIVGGASLDNDTHEFWRRLVYSVFQGYGLTEAAPMVTMFNPFRHDRQSVGKLIPGQEIRIGAGGEILLRGDNVMSGYYLDPANTKSVLDGGWLRTGDIGKIDGEGHLFIQGRIKDMISTSDGHNVFAEDVEKVLRGIAGVRDAVVFGSMKGGGESVQAALIMEAGASGDAVVRKANTLLLPFQRIRGFTIWTGKDFPRTSTQKVKKSEVLKAIGTKASRPESGDLLEGLVPGRADPNARLVEELGLDSLDLVEVVSRVEKKYGVSIDESLIGPGATVGDLERMATRGAGTGGATPGTGGAVPGTGAFTTAAPAPAAAVPGFLSSPGQTAAPAAVLPMPRWARSLPVRVIRRFLMDFFVLPGFRVVFRVRARESTALLQTEEPCIIAANHTSNLDPVFLLLALPMRFRGRVSPAMGLNRFHAHFTRFAAAKKPHAETHAGSRDGGRGFISFLHGAAYFLVTLLFQTFPFPQGTAYRPSLEYTGELLDRGLSILIFPEGEVSRSRQPRKFRGGMAKIAELTEAPVLPVGIKWGKSSRKRIARQEITVSFGKPARYGGDGHDEFAQKVETEVRELARE